MKYRPELFRDDYNLDALQSVQVPNQSFEMWVTPRFVSHYGDHRFEPLTAALIRSVARRKQMFLDVGAHYGFFSILAGLENPDLRVHALEPIPENMEILRRNLQLNELSNVHCVDKAASDRTGVARIHKSRAADNSGFHPHPDAPPLGEMEIETVALSALLGEHSADSLLVKIDTDGHEIPVLDGLADGLVANQDATLIVEFNPPMQRQAGHEPRDLLVRLADMGFATFLVQESNYRLIPVDANTDWSPLIGPAGYANLYCRPKDAALNICFLSHSHEFAGAERSLAELVEQLVEYHGVVCNVVIPGDGPLRARIEAAGAGVILAEYGWWCSSDSPSQEQIRERLGDDLARFLARTLPEVERTRPDLICTNSMVIPYGAILASILHRPHIWSLHEYGGQQNGYEFYLPFDEVLQVVAGFSDFIFAATRTLPTALFPQLPESSYDFLYPYIRAPELPASAMETGTSAAAEASRSLQLLELSSLTRSKQQEVDLRAVADLVERGCEVELLLKGPQDKEYVAFLEELARSLAISDRICFEDYGENVWPLLDAADVVLISAPTHCFGRIAAEGMLRAKPVIYPRGTDIAEYMEDDVTGLGYEAGNSRQMADQIHRLIADPALRRRIGAAAHRRATELFTRVGFADKFLDQARKLQHAEPLAHPPLPRPVLDSLLTGIQRLSRESLELRSQLAARSKELADAAALATSRDEEIASIRPVLAARDSELASIKPVLAARQQELQATQRELESVRSILEARDEELAGLRTIVAAREDELGAVKPVLEAREAELAALKSALAESRKELDTVKPMLAERQKEIAAIKPMLAERNKEIAAMKPVLAARDDELASIRPVIRARDAEIAEIQAVLKERERELASLKPVLAARENELANLKRELTNRDKEVAAAKPVLASRAEKIADLETSLEHEAEEVEGLGKRLEMTEEILDEILATRLGRLALWIARKK